MTGKYVRRTLVDAHGSPIKGVNMPLGPNTALSVAPAPSGPNTELRRAKNNVSVRSPLCMRA